MCNSEAHKSGFEVSIIKALVGGTLLSRQQTSPSFCSPLNTEELQRRVQLRPPVHRRGDQADRPRQALHDEPGPGGVLRLLLPQPGVCPTRLGPAIRLGTVL